MSVNIRSANLRNDNGSYTKGTASTTFKNVNGRWFTSAKSEAKANHTYDFTYIKSGDVYGTGGTNGTVAACYSKDKTGLALQNKWANIKAEGCDNWWTGIDDSHLYNYTLNNAWHQYIKTGSTVAEEGEEPIVTYAGSDGKVYQKQGCDIVVDGTMENCLYGTKALVNGAFVTVEKNTAPDEGYHKSGAATTYYLCFDGCVWHPATRDAENLYTVDGTKYIWYNNAWLAVTYDSTVKLYYSLSATNVRIYYEYIDHAWVLASPVAEVITSAGTEQVFSLEDAKTKAKAGGTNVTIRLLKDMKITSAFTYDGANNCSLDLNGFTLTGTVTSMITINNASATFIIKDQSGAGTGKILSKFSRSDNKVYGLNVTKGHLMINSGTVHVENTHASQGACGVYVAATAGNAFTMNGGTLEITSKGESWGVHTVENARTSTVTINGGTIDTKTTSTTAAIVGIHSLGGNINVNGGTLATSTTSVTTGLTKGIEATNAKSTLTINGGTIESTAPSKVYGVYTAVAGSNVTINGGKISATAVDSLTAGAVFSYGPLTINGGKIYAEAKTNYAYGVYAYTGSTIINTSDTIHTTAGDRYSYGVYTRATAGRLWFNNGVVDVTGKRNAYGLYNYKSTDTINGGEFLVYASQTSKPAYGVFAENNSASKVRVNGGKFKVTAATPANANVNNTTAWIANLSLAGGYYNIAPKDSIGGTYIAAGKSVKDVVRAKEQAIYDAGYVKKIAGNEYTVTWKSFNGATTLGTSQVESGQVPVWTGERPDYKDATSEREWIGWATDTWNRGTKYVNGTPLPAIAASDVTYYAACQAIYADVTAGGTTTRYNSAQTAWTEAMKHKQATIRILTNLGSEASVGNMTELVFNPANEGSIITLDLNGHIWTMGNHSTASYNKNIFLNVAPSKANCKLIVTDNSASGNGYLMNKWACGENLICANVATGELILQGGGLKCNNTHASCNAVGVQANGGVFTMTGGIIEAKKEGDAVTAAGAATGVYAYSKTTLSGGTINATHAKYQAAGIQVMRRNVQTTLEDGLTVNVNGCQAFGVYGYGAADITGGIYNVTATKDGSTWSTARGIYMTVSGENYGLANVTGNPTFTVNGMNAASYGVYSYGNSNVAVNVDSGTFNVYITNGDVATGVTAQAGGVATIKGGTFTSEVKTSGKNNAFGVWAQEAGVVNVEGGTFTAIAPQDGGNNDAARINGSATNNTAQLNISGGSFTMTKGGYAVRAFGGTTHISGNPTFTARYGIDIASWAAATCTATMVVDGGTFNATVGDAVRCYTTSTVKDAGKDTEHTDVVTGDLTIWDGKFHSPSSIKPVIVNANTSTSNIKIRGGYYSSYTSSNLSDLTKYVVSPSTAEALASGTTEYTEGYRYRVNTKYNVTFSVNGVNTVKQYNRNETPDFGSTPAINDGNTYDFIGWTPEIAPVTTDATYTAVFKKWEAEIIMPNGTSKRYESFATAWTDAQQLQNCTLRLLSNVNSSVQLTYNPAPPAGTAAEDEAYFTNATTTLDLNNHTLAFTGTANDRFLVINKTGSKFIIDDNSAQKNGVIKYESTRDGMLICVATHYGDLELRGGTILARNNNATNTSVGVYPCRATTFTMTGGNIKAYARQSAKGVYTEAGGTEVVNISGGAILASTEYDNSGTPAWGNYSYGVHIRAGAKAILDGTYTVTSQANQDAYGIYAEGTSATAKGEITVKSGTVTAITKTKRVFGAWVNAYGTININGGTIDAHSTVANVTSMWNIEGAHCSGNGILNISGGDISSSNGASPIGVSIHGGKTTITGGKITSKTALHAVDYATATQTATVIVNGGTFIATDCAVRVYGLVRDGTIKNNANVTINGGYFSSTGSYIAQLRNDEGANPSTLVLNGGKYCEKSGTTFKNQINALKGATTTITDINETVDGKTYKYQLLTDFTVTWKGGSSYTKSETVRSGKTPSNTEVTSFVRNDSTFYFTGWTPTPSPVITDITYQAEGEYHVAKVKIGSGAWTIYDDFDEAWNDAMAATNANVNITLLNNVTLNDYLAYTPAIANARTTLDLNNFKLTNNNAVYTIHINKQDAKLTITDTSAQKGGCVYKKKSSNTNIYGVYVYRGEVIMAGGKVYCENTIDDSGWHPAGGLYNASANAKITVTDGTVEAAAQITAYAITGYGPVNVSGGLVKATVKKYNNARALSQQMNTATITGGTFEAYSTGNATGSYAVMAGAWIGSTAASAQSSIVNISGGKFKAQTASSSAVCAFADGVVKKIGEEIVTAHGTLNITGGEFTTLAPAATATQIFSVVSNGARLFDDDHNLIGESRAETTISGGTFLVDTRDNGAYVENKNNNCILRCWGTMNITGGTFTIYQNSGATGIGCYRGKVTISGNPIFNINGTTQTRGLIASPWNHSSYCDKDATNNLAEIEVNGGTFNVTANGTDGNVIGAWTNGSISSTSATDTTALAGYAMSSKITINGGEFICSGQKPVRTFYQYGSVEGTYGTAKREIFVNGGKFKSQIATFNADGTINTVTGAGANVETGNASVKLAGLTGGYYSNNNHLEANRADTCDLITLEETDPEYANGYRYKIEPHYVAKVSKAGASDRFFCVMKDAFDYAKTQDNSTITLLRTVDDYVGSTLYYSPSTAKSCTLDLNGFTFKGQSTGDVGTGADPDRLLIVSKVGCTFTIKDSSTGKTGKFSHEKNGANYAAVVYHGTLVLESGTVHCKNTSGGAQALRSTGSDAIIQMTGGKAHAEATGTAYAVNSYGPATITGGLLLAEGADARGVNSQDANADVKVKGNAVIKAIASAETAYGLYVAGGGKLTINENACDTAICTTKAARGAYVGNGQLTISGNAKIRANAGTSSYTVLAQGDNANATIEGGTITSYSSANSASITVYALSGAKAHITGGTFYALDNISYASNVSPIRTGDNATMTIDGGIFYGGESGTQYQAVSIRGGETTINGGTFNAAVGIRAMDWADATTITGKLTVKGGTFNTTSQTIYVSSKANNSRNAHSEVTIEGGKFKSTGSTLVQMDAAPTGTTASTLTITGGYFNEKSGTTFKNQIANFVSDPYEVFTLEDGDANKTAGYTYEVCEKRVAKVKTGSTTKYYTTVLAAMDYAKTVANPTITMLHDASLSARWFLNNAIDNWNGVLDLNGKTITSAAGGMTYGMIDVTKAGIKLTIKDSATGGKLLRQDAGTTIWGININNGATLELQSGTIEVKNTITNSNYYTQGVCINTNGGTFNMTGGKVEVHAEKNIYGLNIYKGTANLSGGELAVATDLTETLGNNAYGVYQQTSASALNISGTATVSTKAATEARGIYSDVEGSTIDITGGKIKAIATGANAYGLHINKTATVTISGADSIYAKSATRAYTVYVNAGTTTISGTPAFYAESPTGARVLEGVGTGSITVNGGIFDAKVTTDGNADCYVLIPEGSSALTVNGGKFSSNRVHIAYKATNATLAINGGYFNEYSTGTTHKTQVETYCVAPKHCLPMTAAEIATVGSDYKYKVVDAYTLTWTTDGDALTGDYTSGLVEPGAAITAPATPTKTGYTFAAWSPAFTGTMPAANTTYTATWTVNSYTIRFLNYDGSVLQTGSVNYGETPAYNGATPTKPADATYTYTFSGWSPAIGTVTGAQDYTAQFSQTENVASVTVNSSGYTLYYTDFSKAFKAAKDNPAAVTITLLKDVSSPALVYSGINTDCTLDLNGHTLTSASPIVALNIYQAGTTFTITDKTESKSGQIKIVSTQADEAYGLYVYAGHLKLEAGTIYASLAAATCAGVRAVNENSSFTMEGGTIHVVTTNAKDGIGVMASNGATVINGGTIQVEAAADGYGIKREGGTVTINNGKFNISASGSAYATNLASANANVVIKGGYYTTNSRLNPTAPYHVFDLTGESPYRYEVAEGYTLTWNLGGGTVTAAGTAAAVDATGTPNDYVKAGATITAPTVTRTGYTFSAWSPAVAATMPAEDKTYTAQWTAKSCTVTFNKEGGFGGSDNVTATYGSAMPAITAPTRTGYTFGGYYDGDNGTGTQYYTSSGTSARTWDKTANTTLYAKWTSDTYTISYDLDGGSVAPANPTSYTVESSAITLNNPTRPGYVFAGWTGTGLAEATATVTIPAGSTGNRSYIATWTPAVASVTINTTTTYYATLAEAFEAASGSETYASKITVLKDVEELTERLDFTGKKNCTLDLNGHTVAGTATTLLYINASGNKLTINDLTAGKKGKLSLEPASTGSSYCVFIYKGTVELKAGTIYANYSKGSGTKYGVYCRSSHYFTMDGGLIDIETTSNRTTCGVYSLGTTNINAGKIKVKSTATAYGVDCAYGTTTISTSDSIIVSGTTAYGARVGGYTPTATKSYNGELTIESGIFKVTSSTANANGVYVYTGTFTDNGGIVHNDAGTAYIKGGEFIIETKAASKYAMGVYVQPATAEPVATPKAHITGGKFKLTSVTANYYYATYMASPTTALTVEGGYYNVNKGISYYVAPTNVESSYYCVPTTDADKAEVGKDYEYKVVADANTGFHADIVDVDNSTKTLTLNVTGWASGGWPYTINGVEYQKTAREADRTLIIPYTGAPGDNFAMQIKKASGDEISNRIYVIPQEITSNTAITAKQTKDLYVKGATLTVNGSISAKNIYVAPDAALVINSGKTLTADSIFLRTTASSSAQMDNNGKIAGEVLYTRIIKDKDFHFFGLPLNCAISAVKLSDGVVPQYGSGWLLRSYDEARRAVSGADDNNWVSVTSGATISGGKGYEMYSASNYYREFYFPVDLNGLATSVPLEFSGIGAAGKSNAGWNALVSPLTKTYENAKVPEGLVVGWYRDGWYEQEIPATIPAATAFVFQANKAGDLSFEGTSIVAALPRRASDEETRIQWLNVDLEDADGVGDQTSIYAHPTRYEQSYKAGIDVAKQSFEASRAILYSSHAYGEMAFAGVADSVLESGVALTIYSPKEQELTFSMRENEWLNRMEYVWLIDHETGAATDLLYDTYTFSSPAGTTSGRFTIQGVFKAPQITTGIDAGDGVKAEAEKARKVLIDQKMYILLDGAMYDATGKRVNK